MISIVLFTYLLLGYAISIFTNSFIENHYDSICLILLFFGLIGFGSSDKDLTKFLKNISCRFKGIPIKYQQIIFIKSVKYEVFTFISFITLLTIISFPLLLTKINMRIILSIIAAWVLFLITNKSSQVLSFVFYTKWIKLIKNIGEIISETIIIFYFLNIFRVKISININRIFNWKLFKISNLELLIYSVAGILLYLLLYKTLVIVSIRYNTKNDEVFLKKGINPSNIFYKKFLREMINSGEFHFVSNLLIFPLAWLMIKLLLLLSIISMESLNLQSTFIILTLSQAILFANFIFLNISSDRKIIKGIIQTGYDLRKYLLRKAFVSILLSIANILISVVTMLSLSLIDLKIAAYCAFLLFINGISLALTVQIFSNISIRYKGQERFENSMAFPVTISVLFIQVTIEEMTILMNTILKVSINTVVVIMSIYIIFTLFINILLFILLRRNFYGEYRFFIR
ncbi:hypothetical protein [Oenococcus oeni]|uniref:hypothetical protein n=1 Tax=Oenococcus oeni TaxID=1247 RepID=UPI00295466A8|nr:hypothetical protein [Oenococcus oeni]MDV7687557.1 hypothetical protein [Oenococcus oeni]